MISPESAFSGMCVDFERAANLAFGDYCEVFKVTLPLNSMEPRTKGCIAMSHTGNNQGTWIFYCLSTRTFIKGDRWKVLPTPGQIIDEINRLAESDKTLAPLEEEENPRRPVISFHYTKTRGRRPALAQPPPPASETIALPVTPVESPNSSEYDEGNPGTELDDVEPTPISEPVLRGGIETSDTPKEPESTPAKGSQRKKAVTFVLPNEKTPYVTRSGRVPKPSGRLATEEHQVLKAATLKQSGNISVSKALKEFPEEAETVIVKELTQMFQKRVFQPIHPMSLTADQEKRRITSFLFIKEKYNASGKFEKLKGRLVAGGHKQDRELYEDISSPTVSTPSVFLIAALAAAERRHVVTMDITGAYLNAPMSEHEVFMTLDPTLSDFYTRIDPSASRMIDARGRLTVKLLRALYGCIESAKLWYDHLSGSLHSLGFDTNPMDRCIFFKSVGQYQVVVAVYVDDLLVTCESEGVLQETVRDIKEIYKEVTVNEGKLHSYLRMNFDFSYLDECRVSMPGYISEMMKDYNVVKVSRCPNVPKMCEPDPESPALSSVEFEEFRSRVAKLMFVAKRCRPDVLFPVAYLASRVSRPTAQDKNSLERVLSYLNCTKDLVMILKPDMKLEAYVDASYAIHADGVSHSGVVVTMGGGPLYAESTRQSLVVKSSTEAELVGISDGLNMAIWTREFLLHQGYSQIGAVRVHQDNTSSIVLAEKGYSTSKKTRHIAARFFFVHDRIRKGEVSLVHTRTENMIADILTKPVGGAQYERLRDALLGLASLDEGRLPPWSKR